jgi:hypothetical protein
MCNLYQTEGGKMKKSDLFLPNLKTDVKVANIMKNYHKMATNVIVFEEILI